MASILNGNKMNGSYDFGSVPKDEDVALIAIKKFQDKFYLGVFEGTTDNISELELDFIKMSLQEIKTKIEALNTSFYN